MACIISKSKGIHIQAGGYFPFGEAPSNHRALWIKVKFQDVFCYNMKTLIPPEMRQLKHDNPRIVKNGLIDTKNLLGKIIWKEKHLTFK